MDIFQETIEYDSKKVYQVQALYNKQSTCEFVLQPEKDFIMPMDIYLNFSVEIKGNYLMDNQADKLFDSVEVIVANEKVTSRSNSGEYFLSSFFRTKANHPRDHFSTQLVPSGWYGNENANTGLILTSIEKAAKDDKKSIIVQKRDGYPKMKGDKVDSRIYTFSMQIQSPLFQQAQPLPSNVTVHINFKRAKANLAVILIDDSTDKYYDKHWIPLINPYLEVTALRSDKLAKKYNFLTSDIINYPIEQNVIRTHTIDTGNNHVDFSVTTGGHLPKMIFAALVKPEAFQGDETLSATCFERHDLTKFELSLNNNIISGSQVHVSDQNLVEAYTKFFRQCKMIPNSYAGSIMYPIEFHTYNFMMAYDLTSIEQKTGWLNVLMDFKANLASKLMLIVYMVFDKEITIDSNRNVTIN